MTTDSAGNIYALGNFVGTVNFSASPVDALVGAGGMEIYIGGYLFSMFNFGGETPWLVSDGEDDAFLAKVSN